jgi:thiaminase
MYSSDAELDTHTQKIIEIFDRLASEGSENLRVSMEAKFMAGVRYETMCWDAYFDMEEWINH